MKLKLNDYAKITHTGQEIKILDIHVDEKFSSGFKIKYDDDIGSHWISADCLEPCDPPQPEASHDGSKLGKRKTKDGHIVDVKAKAGDWAWCWFDDGSIMTLSVESLTPIAKFDHLRGLAVDTKVVVWTTGNSNKLKRHFSHVSKCGNAVLCYDNGCTSFTVNRFEDDNSPIVCDWNNCEVWDGE